jgi:hypothetical protein
MLAHEDGPELLHRKAIGHPATLRQRIRFAWTRRRSDAAEAHHDVVRAPTFAKQRTTASALASRLTIASTPREG